MTIKVRVLLSLSLFLVSTRLPGQFVTKEEDKQTRPPKTASVVAPLLSPSVTGGVSREGILYKEIVPPTLALSDRYTNKPDIDVATAEALAVGRAKYLWGGSPRVGSTETCQETKRLMRFRTRPTKEEYHE